MTNPVAEHALPHLPSERPRTRIPRTRPQPRPRNVRIRRGSRSTHRASRRRRNRSSAPSRRKCAQPRRCVGRQHRAAARHAHTHQRLTSPQHKPMPGPTQRMEAGHQPFAGPAARFGGCTRPTTPPHVAPLAPLAPQRHSGTVAGVRAGQHDCLQETRSAGKSMVNAHATPHFLWSP